MSPRSLAASFLAAVTLSLLAPAHASAQFYFAGYFGANTTSRADVSVDVPAADLSITYRNVNFEGRPFESPQYYGWRFGRMFGERKRYGLELEFIHSKVIADTTREYDVTGRTASGRARMDDLVDRYAMTHGLNFVLINGVTRRPVGSGRLAFTGRLGVGSVLPHTETTVLEQKVDKYEWAGVGADFGIGTELRLRGPLTAMLDYKLTYAKPEISVAGGQGRTSVLMNQVAFGLVLRFAR